MEGIWKEDIAPVFKLTDLTMMYKNHLEQLGAVVEGHIRFKHRLMSAFPGLQAHHSIVLGFDEDFSAALTKACDFDDDVMYLVHMCCTNCVQRNI